MAYQHNDNQEEAQFSDVVLIRIIVASDIALKVMSIKLKYINDKWLVDIQGFNWSLNINESFVLHTIYSLRFCVKIKACVLSLTFPFQMFDGV